MQTEHDFLELFDELSFLDKWKKVFHGIRSPKDSGEYKYSKLQILRLLAPLSALIVPFLMLALIMVLASIKKEYEIVTSFTYEKFEEVVELDPIEKIEPEKPKEYDTNIEELSMVHITDAPAPSPAPPGSFAKEKSLATPVLETHSPLLINGPYSTRPGAGQPDGTLGNGGTPETEGAVLKALRWLKKEQLADGSWEKNKPAMTSLALLTYLAHGETPMSKEFGETVEKAIRFLVNAQEPNGHFKGRDGHDYTQPIAAYALSEAFGMTKIPIVKEAATRAIDIIIEGQHPSGGWDYGCKQTDRDDTSYMGWCAQALKAGRLAGLNNDGLDNAIDKAANGFRSNYDSRGGFGYTGPSPSHGLTGAGVLCMQLLGRGREVEVRKGLMTLTQTSRIDWRDPKGSIYYWYYNTQAFFHAGGDLWDNWNKNLKTELVGSQHVIKQAIADPEGKLVDIGWWNGKEINENHSDGLVMDTCLCALQLQVYYRNLPTYKHPEDQADIELESMDDIDIEIEIDADSSTNVIYQINPSSIALTSF